jgi:hypothetical protein
MKNRIRIRKTFIRIHNTDFLKELKKLFCFLTNISALGCKPSRAGDCLLASSILIVRLTRIQGTGFFPTGSIEV